MTRRLATALSLLGVFVAGAGAAALASWSLATFGVRMRIDHELAVQMPPALPLRAAIARPLSVRLPDHISASVYVHDIAIPIDEIIDVPLRLDLDVPIDTTIAVDQDIEVDVAVPLDIVLTEREIDLNGLEVAIDTDVLVDELIAIDTVIPIESEVTTTLGITMPVKMQVPVKANIPIRQMVRIRKTIKPEITSISIPLKMNVPIKARIPFKEELRVVGNVKVPIRERIRVPLRKTMRPQLVEPLAASVKLEGLVPATLDGELEARVSFDSPIAAGLSSIHLDSGDVALERRRVAD